MPVNNVILTGHLTRDAERRQTRGGTCVLEFGLAVNERRHNTQTDEWEDCPNFFDCTMFGRRADAVANWMRKGLKVTVSGTLRQERWEKDGQSRSKVKVIVNELEAMSKRREESDGDYNEPAYGAQQSPYDEDIPF